MSALYIPNGYTPEWKGCDGCGTGWNEKVVPDTIYFLSIKKACCIHDYMYEFGEKTAEAKAFADEMFLHNMLCIIDEYKAWYYPHFLARRRAFTYYQAVRRLGDGAYFN